MVEIFADIPQEIKATAEIVFQIALWQKDVPSAIKVLQSYLNSCEDTEEKAFVDFYFSMRLEELKNANNND